MHHEILTDRQREGLAVLSRSGLLARFYLVGGTAAALHLGHRRSVDFDFFTEEDLDPGEVLPRLEGSLSLEVRRQSAETLHLMFHGVPLTFLRYPYPLLESTVEGPSGLRLIQQKDLMAMKLVAVSQRGTRKDFIDIYFLCQSGMTLREGMDLLPLKYQGVRFEPYHIINSLQYFADAEKQDIPHMLVPFAWEECKAYFHQVVPPLARSLFGRGDAGQAPPPPR